MEQTKALNAIEPFIALSKSATSPRAAADLITRATSAPNTFIFAELLQTPNIQALEGVSDSEQHLRVLQIFSYGTYQTYRTTSGLPDLNEAQTLKLKQLSLLTLARERKNLSYIALQQNLELSSERDVEDLVITAIYAGLLEATLDPARQMVQVTRVSPLRDLSPGSVPNLMKAMNNWSTRCTTTLEELDLQIKEIKLAAVKREKQRRAGQDKLQAAIAEVRETDPKGFGPGGSQQRTQSQDMLGKKMASKRGAAASKGNIGSLEIMDVDEPLMDEEKKKRVGKRKM